MPNIAFVIAVTEHERGWGQRPDGYMVCDTEASADAFIKRIGDERRGHTSVPDDYDSYEKLGYKEVSDEVFALVQKHGSELFRARSYK